MKVLIAIDQSEASERVLEYVPRLISDSDHEILVMTVEPTHGVAPITWTGLGVYPPAGLGGYPPPVEPEQPTEHEPTSDSLVLVERASAAISADETLVKPGDAVSAILSVAEREEVELIVVGSSDKGLLARAFKGSVSHNLIDKAPCPVLVVR